MLNKVSGNMYPWVTHTWNPVGGACPHKCTYCYIRRSFLGGTKYDGDPRLVEKYLNDDLGEGNFIFVQSAADLFAHGVRSDIIKPILEKCKEHPDNHYLFQSKNPQRIFTMANTYGLPSNSLIATTIETNRENSLANAPSRISRRGSISTINERTRFRTMISIEPVMDFDVTEFTAWLWISKPQVISIGADSKQCDLPEPSADKLKTLYDNIRSKLPHTEIKLKKNLKRLWDYGGEQHVP